MQLHPLGTGDIMELGKCIAQSNFLSFFSHSQYLEIKITCLKACISGDAVSVNLEIKERVEAQPQCIPGVAVPVDQESIKAL